MLAIGFTNVYYTLWNIESEIVYYPNGYKDSNGNGSFSNYQKITYTYLQNLSKDEDKALLKAKLKGCTNLIVDKDLFGRNESFSKQIKLYSNLTKNLSPFFEFGKYFDKKIYQISDIEYIYWYYTQTENRYCKKILLENGYIEYDSNLISDIEYLKISEKEKEKKKTNDFYKLVDESDCAHIIINPTNNIDGRGILEGIKTSQNISVNILFREIIGSYYRGYNYYLPSINGKGKRIKGKELVLLVKLSKYNDQYLGEMDILEVVNIKSIKNL